ncbi:MAG TPA: ABC transporter ATP-binding protein [Candidatus Alectryocaccomicrobium excrementavium]|uniref:ABC transporter ATP-binding protein n=1 Tax=Candidatus Alectryocaccomicrobium excrementavium TaxID=2840668 RepID=A0A9D1K777_9FIRM|nr:ABC transporter ATP-binding protein [Candidatus Alectryocaccomicrobium excrementavium]
MDSIALSAKNLSKSFGTQTVLQDVHLHLTSGKIYGLVGRNGSGKTVLLKMLCGFMRPDKGEIAINGQPVVCGRKLPVEIGILFDAAGFIPNKTAYANLKILAGIRNRISPAGVRAALEMVGLDPASRKRVGAFSLGMRQRLAFAQALMEDPPILFCDEPMNSLDASIMQNMRAILRKEGDKGKLILLATHMREDLETLCDEVFSISDGHISAPQKGGDSAQ